MTQRIFLLFASILMVATAMAGCRNSAKTAAPAPTASPTPAAQVKQPVPAPSQPAAQADAAPASPIQVKPPASFSADQLPQGRVEFALAGSSGQFLLMKASEVEGPITTMAPITAIPSRSSRRTQVLQS